MSLNIKKSSKIRVNSYVKFCFLVKLYWKSFSFFYMRTTNFEQFMSKISKKFTHAVELKTNFPFFPQVVAFPVGVVLNAPKGTYSGV